MKMKKAAGNYTNNYDNYEVHPSNYSALMGDGTQYSPGDDLYPGSHTGNTNVAFCGVMVVSIIMAVIAMCYCCHKGGRKRENEMLPPQPCRWRYGSSTLPLHIYTVEGHQFCESEDLVLNDITGVRHSTPSPPPEYETVIGMPDDKEETVINDNTSLHPLRQQTLCEFCTFFQGTDETGLPSYEMAVSLTAPTSRHI